MKKLNNIKKIILIALIGFLGLFLYLMAIGKKTPALAFEVAMQKISNQASKIKTEIEKMMQKTPPASNIGSGGTDQNGSVLQGYINNEELGY